MLHYIVVGNFVGIRSTNNNFYTDFHWRCSPTEQDGWFKAWFDESSWSNAFAAANHTSYDTSFLEENFGVNAKMIWYFDASYEGTIYCRARLFFGL